MFKKEYKDIPTKILQDKLIYNLMILLKRKRDQFEEVKKHKCRLVMNGSQAVVGQDVFDTFAPVIESD